MGSQDAQRFRIPVNSHYPKKGLALGFFNGNNNRDMAIATTKGSSYFAVRCWRRFWTPGPTRPFCYQRAATAHSWLPQVEGAWETSGRADETGM